MIESPPREETENGICVIKLQFGVYSVSNNCVALSIQHLKQIFLMTTERFGFLCQSDGRVTRLPEKLFLYLYS